MKKSYPVAKLSVGGNVTDITVTAEDDGGLTLYDLSYGPVADMCYGEDRDVEVWIELVPGSVERFARHLFGSSATESADKVARHLAARYEGDSRALSTVQQTLDELGIPFKKMMWH